VKIKVSDYIADFLYAQRVTCVFELVGGMITHIIDSIHRRGEIRLISMHHEQGAAFAAEGFARITGVPAVAMATSGPGATNLLTGIGSCFFDSTPAVFITGQVNRSELKGDRPIRQLGFQETDIVAMVEPITKQAWRVSRAEDFPSILEDAFRCALSGRPGPVLVDIPMDVQREIIEVSSPPTATQITTDGFNKDVIQALLSDLEKAQRPLILAGGGLRSAGAVDVFRSLVADLGIPVINSLMGVDTLAYANLLHIGLLGSYGNRWANLAIGRADFLLVLGSRLDIRQTGADTHSFKGERTIFHVDVSPGEINNRVQGCTAIHAHLQPFLQTLQTETKGKRFVKRSDWLAELASLKAAWPDTGELENIVGINPNFFMHQLSRRSENAGAYVVDVGQHQMWAAQSLELTETQRFLTSGGMGAMGFSLPCAIGAAFGLSDKPVVLVAGDGGFQLNIQELQTVVRNHLPIKLVVLNNQSHGMVRQFQQSYFDEHYPSTYWGYSAPNFVSVAQAYGIEGTTISEQANVDQALNQMWAEPSAPFMLQVMIDPSANAYPKIAFGHPITEMEPFVKPLGMEST
jgi:acetolactate synthase-1/2/3 large subunit